VCAGIEVVLSHGASPERVLDYMRFVDRSAGGAASRPQCTVFHAVERKEVISGSTMNPHRRWLLALPVRGTLVLDEGACKAVASKNSLMAAGVVQVSGRFLRDESVSLVSRETGAEIARALMNLDSSEIDKIKGLKSSEYEGALGFAAAPEISYRTNIVLVAQNEA
jgi:glutamate 5-kinase